jgi:serine protease
MTAGQAVQQVRATATPKPLDSTRRDLVGRGLVNALQAVTDTNTYSARIENVSVADDLAFGHFVAGESGGIVLSVRNYLKPVRQLWAKLDVFQGADAVTLASSTVSFGPANENQTVQNIPAALRLSVSNTVQANTLVTIKVTFFDTLVGYGPDIDYFSFVVGPNYLDLDTNNLTVTFSSRGTIGYNDPTTDNQGSGFRWRNAPPAIGPLAQSVLFNGGIMIGTDPQHLVDVVINQSDNNANHDLGATETIHVVTPERGAAQELVCSYSDSVADSATRVGIGVTQRAYAFTQGLAANAVVVQYILRNQPGLTGWLPSDSTAAALFMDWDIGIDGMINVTRFDSFQNAAVTYRIEPNYPFVGMKIISALPPGASLNYHAIRNDGSQGDINTYGGGFDKSGKWRAMTEFFSPAGPSDISMAMGLKNLPLASQDSVEMTVVFALAQSSDLLQQTIDSVASLWTASTASVALGAGTPALDDLTVYPEPFRDVLHVEWSGTGGPATVSIVDAIGRIVSSQEVRTSGCEFSSLNVVPGVYFVEVRLTSGTLIRRAVSFLR